MSQLSKSIALISLFMLTGLALARAEEKKSGQIKAKVLDEGADVSGEATSANKVNNERGPNTSGSDLPYPEEELKQSDPILTSPNKNMPVDQD